MKVEVLNITPLWVCAKAIRTAWSSHDKSDTVIYDSSADPEDCKDCNKHGEIIIGEKDKALIDRVGNKYKHSSTLEHIIIVFTVDSCNKDIISFFKNNPFSKILNEDNKNALIRTNLRVMVENKYKLRHLLYCGFKGTELEYLLLQYKIHSKFKAYKIYECGIVEKHKKTSIYDATKVPKIIKPFINKYGYAEYILSDNNLNRIHKSEHRLLGELFIPNAENKPTINHIDGNKLNNSLDNLEWATYSENERHSYDVLGKQVWNKGKKLPSGREYRGKIKTLLQYDLKGNLVREWFNPTEVQNIGGFSLKAISAVCRGKSKTHKGFIWKYKEEE